MQFKELDGSEYIVSDILVLKIDVEALQVIKVEGKKKRERKE